MEAGAHMKLELVAYLTTIALLATILTTHQWAPAVGLAGLLLIPAQTRGKPKNRRSQSDRYSPPCSPPSPSSQPAPPRPPTGSTP